MVYVQPTSRPREMANAKQRLTLAKVRSNDIDLGLIPDEAHAGRLVAIDTAQPRAEIAVAKMAVGLGSLLSCVSRRECLMARDVIVEQEWWRQMEVALGRGA